MIMRTTAAATHCGISRHTLMGWARTDVRVKRCMFRRGWFIIERLAELGLCSPVHAPGTPVVPVSEQRRSA